MVHSVSEHVRDDGRGIWIQSLDFTAGETWRLLHWCREHGADEFAVLHDDLTPDPLAADFCAHAQREGSRGGARWHDTDLYRLNAESTEGLRALFPSGLFQSPDYGSNVGWVENPTFYRNGELMLYVISHEGSGELRVSPRERESLARIGLRGELLWNDESCAELSMPRVTLAILGHEFPCRSGGPEDEWLRVHFIIESIPRTYGTYCSLNITFDTLAAWQARMAALLSDRVASAVLKSTREGFSLSMSRSDAGGRVHVAVDGRQMENDLWGHFWEFSVDAADVANLASQCAVAIRRLGARSDARPEAAIANDGERRARLTRRFPLVVETSDGA